MHPLIAGLVLALVLMASPASAAITFLRATAAQGTSATLDTTGATLVAVCITHLSVGATIADTRSNTFVRAAPTVTLNDSTTLWFTAGVNVGTGTVFSLTNGASTDTIVVAAFSGIPGAVVERTTSATQVAIASGATISSGSTAATLTADQVVLGCAQLSTGTDFTWTATGGATMASSLGAAGSASTGALSYKIVSATGTQAATFTTTTGGSSVDTVATLKAGVIDTTPPSVPSGAVATTVASFEVDLIWTASTDNVGIANYVVRGCSVAACVPNTTLGTPTTASFQHTGLTASTVYRYTVEAVDPSGNLSGQSAIVETTTQAIAEANLVWTAPTGTPAADQYIIYRCGTTAASCTPAAVQATLTGASTTYKDSSSPNPVACYTVQAVANSAPGTQSSAVCATGSVVLTPVLTVAPPSMVFAATVNGSNPAAQTLTITNQTASTMNWTASDDQAWLNEAPSSGTNNANVTVSVSISGLTAGTYQANLTVSAPGATGNPKVIPVTLNLSPAITPQSGRGGRVR